MSGSDPVPSISARRKRTRDPVLAALDRSGTATRAELCRLTGLSRSAVADCVSDLLAEGIVDEAPGPSAVSGRGRRPATVTLRNAPGVVVGIDLGHAHLTAAVATRGGQVLAECTDELDVDRRPGRALDLAAGLAQRALRNSGHGTAQLLGVAAGIPGPLDSRARIVRAPTILSDWVGLDPAAELGRRLQHEVVVGNDADMGAAGERAWGAARGLDDFLYVKASHGIGAGIVVGGRVYRGSTGIAGEIGHTQIPGANDWCRCGSRGCLETVASVSVVRQQLVHVLTNSTATRRGSSGAPLPELARDPAAARVITDAGRTIGRVVADLVNCLNPAAVVLGGELGSAGEPFVAGVRESIDRHAQPASAHAVQVLGGQLGLRAELLGTLVTAAQQIGQQVP